MADIELVIKIPEGLRKDFELGQWTALSCMEMKNALEKATPLPKGHGRLIDADRLKIDNPLHLSLDIPYVAEDTVEDIIDHAYTIIEADKED